MRKNPGLSFLTRRHKLRKGAKVRVGRSLGGNRGQEDPLLMMGRHMPNEGLIDGWIPTDPWQFVAVGGQLRGGRQKHNSANRAKTPNPEECSAFEYLAFPRRTPKPGEQRVHGRRSEVDQKADPVRLLQSKDRLPKRKQRHQNEP